MPYPKSKLRHMLKHAFVGGTFVMLAFASVLLPVAWLAHHWEWRESACIAMMTFGFGAVLGGFLSTADF